MAICDEDAEIVHEQQYKLRVAGYTDFVDMFRTEQLDLVVVCVPHHVGRLVIEAAITHHIHVLKEKPFATTLAEAQELVTRCEQADIHLMVTLQRRFNPIYTSFTQLADQIGTPFVVDAAYTLHTSDPSDGWRGRTAAADGGCIIDMGYHLIDMILWYFGLPDRVLADTSMSARPDRNYDTEDTALIHFSYDSGLCSSLLLSRFIGPKAEWPSAAVSQIDYFCRVVEGVRPNMSGPRENVAHLSFIAGCYESARTRTYVKPKELL